MQNGAKFNDLACKDIKPYLGNLSLLRDAICHSFKGVRNVGVLFGLPRLHVPVGHSDDIGH